MQFEPTELPRTTRTTGSRTSATAKRARSIAASRQEGMHANTDWQPDATPHEARHQYAKPGHSGTSVDWQAESRLYDQAHRRLVLMARLLRPPAATADCWIVGCSTARLRQLLSPDFDYYGCDVTDHAAGVLLRPDHFRQLDLNRTCDLSHFAGHGIGGGSHRRRARASRRAASLCSTPAVGLSAPRAGWWWSIINFESQRYEQAEKHHPGWIWLPSPDEFRQLLAASGWQIERELPLLRGGLLRGWLFAVLARLLKLKHPWLRREACQIIFQAMAVPRAAA